MFSDSGFHPPSTPSRLQLLDEQPSTTPAGPPPSFFSHASTTPAGPPPSSTFGSSVNQSQHRPTSRIPAPRFQSSTYPNSYSTQPHPQTKAATNQQPSKKNISHPPNTFRAPSSSPPPDDGNYSEGRGSDDDSDSMSAEIENPTRSSRPSRMTDLQSSTATRNGDSLPAIPFGRSMARGAETDPEVGRLAKGLASALPLPEVAEPNSFILETELVIQGLAPKRASLAPAEDDIYQAAGELCRIWSSYSDRLDKKRRRTESIGPADQENNLVKASFVAQILLKLHYPPQAVSDENLSSSRSGRSSLLASRMPTPSRTQPIPKILLDWLNKSHDPLAYDLQEVFAQPEGYSAAENFWDVCFACLLRGRFLHAIKLLRGANWRVAACAADGPNAPSGFSGRQLQQVEIAANRLIAILEACPAVKDDDWDVKGTDWALYRHKVRNARQELQDQIESSNGTGGDVFGAGLSTTSRQSIFGISAAKESSEYGLPSSMADNIGDMYGTLLGGTDAVQMCAFDWLEAVVGITAWWDGEEGVEGGGRGSKSRPQSRASDVTPLLAYRERLKAALSHVWRQDDEQLQVDTSSPMQMAIACVLADDIEGALVLLQSWSLPVAAAVSEIASLSGWLKSQTRRSQLLHRSFSQSDLMVLDYDRDEAADGPELHDTISIEYAKRLQQKEIMTTVEGRGTVEGWQVAAEVLGRLQNEVLGTQIVTDLFSKLPLDSEETTQKALGLCQSLHMEDLAREVAQRYADKLRESTSDYGAAVMFYARSHNADKLKEVLDMLVSYCLVTSSAFPAIADMDEKLQMLITSPKEALSGLARADEDAAMLLSTQVSGYATLRKFYELRDVAVGGYISEQREEKQKREAATALVAVITSAADSIHGGLFDPDVDVVVQVDGLLVLLGEALPLLAEGSRAFSLEQIFQLTQAAEDLQVVAGRIMSQCDAVLQAALANYHDGELPKSLSPVKGQSRAELRREASGAGTGSQPGMNGSQFSLLGSEAYASQELAVSSASGSGSEMLVRRTGETGSQLGSQGNSGRGWDWRAGFQKVVTAREVLGVLKLTLAKRIADGWLQED